MTDAVQYVPNTRHLTSINDLSNIEIEKIFKSAEKYLGAQRDPALPYRIGKSSRSAGGKILASLFLEPSTRTRLSFESAMLRLGGSTITSADPATSSAAKGESLADSVRVISNYADAIVLRHPRDGAARYAARYAGVPIINGGDGSHEHPTQTLCDLFTLRQESKSLKGLNVAISGDLRGSRTIHSFVYALARFRANLILMPAKGMELPAHVDWRLREEFDCVMAPKESYGSDSSIDALYITSDEPHQLSLIPNADLDVKVRINPNLSRVDVVYVTRFQKERWADKQHEYPKVGRAFLKGKKYANTSVMHPLPRVGELDIELDSDSRAVYFKQAAYGVPIRMAILGALLGLEDAEPLSNFPGGYAQASGQSIYSQPHDVGISCANPNCIVHDPMERQYTRNEFFLTPGGKPRLRCVFCETDIETFAIVNRKTRKHCGFSAMEGEASAGDHVAFASEQDASDAGYPPPTTTKAKKSV